MKFSNTCSIYRSLSLFLVLLLSACGGGSDAPPVATPPPAPTGPVVTYFAGAMPQMLLDYQGRQVMLSLLRDDMVHVAFSGQIGKGMPYFSPMIADTNFTGPASAVNYDQATKRLTAAAIAVDVDGFCFRIYSVGNDAHLLTRICTTDAPLNIQLSAENNSEVLGLGEYLSTSHTSPSWLGLTRNPASAYGNAMTYSNIDASGDAQMPVAYVLGQGMRNYGLFFDTPYPLSMNFAGSNWSVTSNSTSKLGLFVYTGSSLADLRHTYLTLTGKPPVPPLKAFGLWLSEYGFDNWGELDGKLSTLNTQGFPIDGAVLDLQWFGGIQSNTDFTAMGKLTWDTVNFPNPSNKVATYAASGLGLVTIEESYIGAGLPEYTQLGNLRYLAMDCASPCTTPTYLSSNPWWGKGGMMDWSNTAGGNYWHDAKRTALIDAGILGHWTDLGEPEKFSANSYYAGFNWYGAQMQRHADVHNLYNFFWSQSIATNTDRTHPNRRPWILSRSGAAGSQRFGVAMWSGDVGTSFATLNAQMTAQANMSLSGFDYYGSDIGGFHRDGVTGTTLDTIYTRWLATSALLDIPVRPHTENLCNCKETAPDRVGDKPSNLAALKLRYQLTPYLYSLAHSAYSGGEPIFPPLVYHFQSDTAARAVDHTKMIGPWLVFTGLTTDASNVDTYLPSGKWADFYHPERIINSTGTSSAQAVVVDGLVRAPLFLREGAIIPLLRAAPNNLGVANGAQIQWFNDLVIRTYPSTQESSFTMTEDDGATRDYQKGKVARTVIRAVSPSAGNYHIIVTPDNRTGSTGSRKLAIDLITTTTPQHITVNGSTFTGTKSQTGNVLRIELGTVNVDAVQDIVIAP